MQENKLIATLRILCEREIQFILVGGLAAVLHGAPIQTYDVDVVYALEPGNIDRLLKVLEASEAIYRIQPERRLRPTRRDLSAGGHLNLLTIYGPVDLLGMIGPNLSFVDLLPRSDEMKVSEEICVRVLNLETIIFTKEYLGSEKDIAVLPLLRQTLREAKKKPR
ncbi:MAG: hypothetical protein ACR2NN_09510 [Bryobacteraceae bacterium]